MPIVIDSETYLTAKEAAEYIGITRPTFYKNVRSQLTEHTHGALKRTYYKQSDLNRFKSIYPSDTK